MVYLKQTALEKGSICPWLVLALKWTALHWFWTKNEPRINDNYSRNDALLIVAEISPQDIEKHFVEDIILHNKAEP